MSEAQQQRRDSNPLSSSSLIGEPIIGLTGGASNRATTTERRTTTTTTTKRTIKSSDDFIPAATDIQQVRSESRTGSISSSTAGTPLFSSVPNTTSGMSSSQSQSHHSSATTKSSSSKQNSNNNNNNTQNQSTNINLDNNNHIGSSTARNWSSSTTTSSTQQATGTGAGGAGPGVAAGDGLQSPIIQDTEEGRVLKLRFDVSQYEPDEIVVKTVDNRLTVQAKHEERSENRSVYREYNREFHLPDGIDIEQIKSSLSKDGVLTVDCPLPAPQLQGASRRIPIDRA